MKRVTRKNLEKLIEMKKMYLENKDEKLLKEINDFIENVINKDSHYFSKLSSYNFSKEELEYLM